MLFYGEFLENKRFIIYGRQLIVITKKKGGRFIRWILDHNMLYNTTILRTK
jgi:hypothetical protein